MRIFAAILLASCACTPAVAGELSYAVTGGERLTVQARAQQQIWRVHGGDVLVAAVVDGRLVLEPFQWPPGPSPTPPNPQPGPVPDPQPGPTPQPGPKTVLWIEETEERTPSQAQAILDSEIRKAVASAGWSLRVVDDDVIDESGATPVEFASYIAAARLAGLPRVFILQQGVEVYSGAAPKDPSSFASLLSRFGLPVGGAAPTGVPDGPLPPHDADKGRPDQGAASGCPDGQCPLPQTRATTTRRRLFR